MCKVKKVYFLSGEIKSDPYLVAWLDDPPLPPFLPRLPFLDQIIKNKIQGQKLLSLSLFVVPCS